MMKKVLVVLLVFVMIFSMAACGSDGGENTETKVVKMGITLSATSQWYPFAEQFATEVYEKTSGAYKVEIYPSDSH